MVVYSGLRRRRRLVGVQWYGEHKFATNVGWIYIGLTVGGAWLGKEIHQFFGGSTKGAPGPSSEPLIVACRSCGQKLRVQVHEAGRVFRCGKCQAQFTLPNGQVDAGK